MARVVPRFGAGGSALVAPAPHAAADLGFARRTDAAPTRTGTLWDFYLEQFGPTDRPRWAPLARAFLGDANVAALERALAARAAERLGDLCPPPSMLTVQGGDVVREALFAVALRLGHLDPTEANLLEANRQFLHDAFVGVSADASQFARWDAFQRFGVSPADAPRPEADVARGDHVEMRRAPFGKAPRMTAGEGMFPGGVLTSMDQVHMLMGTGRARRTRGDLARAVTGSDELRLRALPYGPLPRHEGPVAITRELRPREVGALLAAEPVPPMPGANGPGAALGKPTLWGW